MEEKKKTRRKLKPRFKEVLKWTQKNRAVWARLILEAWKLLND